jgi:excisionase family DNA binding protein
VPIQQARLSSPVTPQPIVPRLLTIKQAAVYLGSAVWAVREAIWAKDLKACKIGRRFVIPREELDAYIDRKIEERASCAVEIGWHDVRQLPRKPCNAQQASATGQ